MAATKAKKQPKVEVIRILRCHLIVEHRLATYVASGDY